jgi:twinkle protein
MNPSEVDIRDVIAEDFELKDYRGYAKGVVHDSLVVLPNKNMFYWNSIGISGGPVDWLMEIKGLTRAEAYLYLERFVKSKRQVSEPQKVLPESSIYQKLLDVFFDLGKTKRDYWYSRGYNDDTIDHFKLGYTGKCYVIPVIFDGVLYNFQCRTPEKKMWGWTRGMGVLPFNFDVLKSNKNVVITESPVNAIAMYQYGYTAVSQNSGAGSWQKWWNLYFNGVSTIVVAYDHDVAGYHGAQKVAEAFRDRSRILVWPAGTPDTYDLNDLLKDGKPKEDIANLMINCTYSVEQFKLFAFLSRENNG